MNEIFQDPKQAEPTPESRAEIEKLIVRHLPEIKRDLIKAGYTAKQVEAMAPAQAVAVYQARVLRYIYQELFKCVLLPYPQALAQLKQVNAKLKKEGYLGSDGETREIFPLAEQLLPSIDLALLEGIKADRSIAALRTIEAVRMHAAANRGQLPKTLSEVTIVPIPSDPLTAKPFPYRMQDGQATLEIPTFPGKSKHTYGRIYEFSLHSTAQKRER